MSRLSSHVLDVARGQPARGVTLSLDVLGAGGWRRVGEAVTDADGRVGDFLDGSGEMLESGTYKLTFDTATYFRTTGQPVFYPSVEVTFTVASPAGHHHIPLLLSPFGYSTYRGS